MKERYLSYDKYRKIPEKDLNGKYIVKDYAIFYYKYGLCHREDGPAIKHVNGDKYWYFNGKLHRLDGPATDEFEFNGKNKVEYYINGNHYSSKEEYEIAVYLYKNQLENYK